MKNGNIKTTMKNKIYTFNEWKENPSFFIEKWFLSKKIEIEKWFTENTDLSFDYFEWTNEDSQELYNGVLFFNEPTIQFKLEILIDAEKIDKEEPVVSELVLKLNGYKDEDGTIIGTIDRTIDEKELIFDLLIELINEFKIEFIEDKE